MKVLLFANTDWYLYNFRLPLAKALRARGYEVVMISPLGEYSTRLTAEGFRCIDFPFSRNGLNPLAELVTLWRLTQLYQTEKPLLVHHFTIKCVLYGGLAARLTNIPAIISSVTGLGHVFTTPSRQNTLVKPFISALYRHVLKRSEVIFQNPDDRAEFLNLALVHETRCHLVRGSGVDIDYFQPRAPQENSAQRNVLMVGRLLKEKGVAEYVEAAEIVKRTMPGIVFLLAGDPDPGNPSSINASFRAAWAAKGDVQFLGHRSDILDLLHNAEIVVLPSYREGTPRSLLEAAACGIPLVATDVPGCREVVADGVNGFLVPVKNSHALAQAIIKLLSNVELRGRMGARARQIICECFSQTQVISETLRIYDVALASKVSE